MKLSDILKNIVSRLALSPDDTAKLHADIEAAVPAAIGVLTGSETPAAAIKQVVGPLIADTVNLSQQRLVAYIDAKVAGISASVGIPAPVVVPAQADPSLVSAAPAQPVVPPIVVEPTTPVVADATPPAPVPVVDTGEADAVAAQVLPDATPPAPLDPDTTASVVNQPVATVPSNPVPETPPVPQFDAYTGEPLTDAPKFDVYTGAPLS